MKLLIDENIRREIVNFLQESGHDIMTVLSGSKNGEIIQLATEEKRILLTHDKHFSDIFLYPPENFYGIVRIKIHPPTVSSVIKALENLLNKISQSAIEKHLIILEKDGFRIYPH